MRHAVPLYVVSWSTFLLYVLFCTVAFWFAIVVMVRDSLEPDAPEGQRWPAQQLRLFGAFGVAVLSVTVVEILIPSIDVCANAPLWWWLLYCIWT